MLFFSSFSQLHQHTLNVINIFWITHSKLITEVHLAIYYSSYFKSIKAICEDNVLKRLRSILANGEIPHIIISTRFLVLKNEQIFVGAVVEFKVTWHSLLFYRNDVYDSWADASLPDNPIIVTHCNSVKAVRFKLALNFKCHIKICWQK